MLLELRQLSDSLKAAGVTPGRSDDHLVAYPNRPAFEVTLDADGTVAGVRPLERERVTRLRKYECSKGGMRESAPGFNVPPLLGPKEGEEEAYREEVTALLRALKKAGGSS